LQRSVCGMLGAAVCALAVAGAPGLWLDVPYIHQEKEGCGSASLAMILGYWQGKNPSLPSVRVEPSTIQQQLYDPKLRGIPASRMEQYLRESGLEAFAFRGDWSDLRANIAKGRPLIAALKRKAAPAHYVVVAGIAPDDAAALVNDPQRGKLVRVERAEFEKAWKGTENWTLLAVPRQPE